MLKIFLLTSSLIAQAAPLTDPWRAADLTTIQEFSDFNGGASYLINIEPKNEDDETAYPTIRVFTGETLKRHKLFAHKSLKEWTLANSPVGKNGPGKIIQQAAYGPNKYFLQFSTSREPTDLQSYFLAVQDGDKRYLLSFDGMGPATTKMAAQVKRLHKEITPEILREMIRNALRPPTTDK